MNKRHTLAVIAGEQGGYFTAQQALSAGYSYRVQHYHTQTGDWIREGRGIYRLRDYPLPCRPDLIALTLLSNDRSGEPHAVVSHETALTIYELSDANPERIHITVPVSFRKEMPAGVIIHRGRLTGSDWEQFEGYRVTTPLRTIVDIAGSPSGWPYLADAVYDALRKGMVRSTQLLLAEGSEQTKAWIHSALQAAEQRARRTRVSL